MFFLSHAYNFPSLDLFIIQELLVLVQENTAGNLNFKVVIAILI